MGQRKPRSVVGALENQPKKLETADGNDEAVIARGELTAKEE